jgi:plasmid stabilization system protein ParE
MNYEVLVTDRAAEELESAARWWAEHRSAAQAERWYDGFVEAILSLAEAPERCAIARERGRFPFEIRQLVYSLGRRPTRRAVFTIRQDKVIVLTIRHLAQDDLGSGDLP